MNFSALTRRRFLEIVGVAGGAVALRTGFQPAVANAASATPGLLLSVYFNGGWDQLLALDPRSNTDFTAANVATTRILPAYEKVQDAYVKDLLLNTPSGLQTRGALTFGPAVASELLDHASDLCVVRGIAMDTLTHEVGRRYLNTGKFPRGLAANGNSLTTAVANQIGVERDLPNLSISTESYNEDMPAYSSAIQVRTATDVQSVLRPLGLQLTGDTDSALEAYQDEVSCAQHNGDADGAVSLFRASRSKARSMLQSKKYDLFQFALTNPPAEVASLFANMKITTSAELSGVKGRAALAGHALAQGVSQAVSVQLVTGLDDHSNWGANHATELRQGFEALGLLINHLKATAAPGGAMGTAWDHTTLIVYSEFSRTPLLNGQDGRDHHLAGSVLLAGRGIRGNQVIGATTDKGMATENGRSPDRRCVQLRPAHPSVRHPRDAASVDGPVVSAPVESGAARHPRDAEEAVATASCR